jgi:hypothetical protein
MHLGRKAESMMAPDAPRPFPLKSATAMVVSMVTDMLSSSPLKTNFANALLSEDVRDISLGYEEGI